MQKGHSTISRKVDFRKSDSYLGEIPSELYSDRGIHFTGQMAKEMC